MLNTKFKSNQKELSEIWNKIFNIANAQGLPFLKTAIYLNEHLEEYYHNYELHDMYKNIFDDLNIKYH